MTEERQIGQHYDQVDFPRGPAIYSSTGLYDAMFELGEFTPRDKPYVVLDAMCGAGLVGKEMEKRLTGREIPHTIHFFDLAEKKIEELRSQGYDARICSVFDLDYGQETFDREYSRFAVKNYPATEQVDIFRTFRGIMKPDGIFVLCDMESPEEAYEFMQSERREKHKYTRLEGSEPHIPTRQIWFQLLREGGLEPKRIRETKSYVTTTDWVKSNQMTANDLEQLNAFLLAAPENARNALNIRQEGDLVKIDYPVVVISAVKT
ncbi:MAG: class I SAM-dependent methyltransferase [Candidatus Aenigmarchaeota archaeon]|nr:class I SAM-dependent methyltransferase [Candidatus Aenigmarchaeota archaeon]